MLYTMTYPLWFQERITMNEILSTALSLLQSLGIMPYITAMLVISVVGGFIAIVFNRNH